MTTVAPLGDKPSGADADAPGWRLGRLLDDADDATAGSPAVIAGEERRVLTYAELAALVRSLSARLRDAGLGAGDVIALRAANSVEFIVALLAASRTDATVAPLDPALPAADIRARIEMAGARVTLTDSRPEAGAPADEHGPVWSVDASGAGATGATPAALLSAPGPAGTAAARVAGLDGDDALIMFTSGTTGTPKMVPWTHANLAAAVAGIIGAYQLGPSDATVAVMPLFHGHGLVAGLLATLTSRGRVLLPARGRFSAGTFWDDVDAVDASWYTAVPTIHQILLERAGTDRPSGRRSRLRFIRSCSAPLSPVTVRRIEQTFAAPVVAAYGMTEATHQASTVLPRDDDTIRMNTVGTPEVLSVRIVDDQGNTCAAGVVGEICLSGPTVVRGYLNDPTSTARTFTDGWLHTGDLGSIGPSGALSIRGRIKELINRGGEKISPERVEELLISHPDVTQAVVFGLADALYGERVAAVVVTRDGSRPDLAAYCRGRLADFEIPEYITFADELPLTAKGSVDRSKVTEQFGR